MKRARLFHSFLVIMVAVAAGASPTVAGAAPAAMSADMAAAMPERTMVYLGWAGCDHCRQVSRDTALGKTLAEPQVEHFVAQLETALDLVLKKAAAEEGNAATYETVRSLVGVLLARPTGIALIDLTVGENGPMPAAALVCNLGDDGGKFLADFEALLRLGNLPPANPINVAGHALQQIPAPVPGGAYYGVIRGHFVLAIGTRTVEEVAGMISGAGASLAAGEKLKASRTKIGGQDHKRLATLFVDIPRITQLLSSLAPMITEGDMEDARNLQAVLNTMIGPSIGPLTWQMSVRERGCHIAAFLPISGERSGLAALQTETSLDNGDLAFIPPNPSWAWAFNFKPSEMLTWVKSTLRDLDADAYGEFIEGITEAEAALGLRIDEDLLRLMGDTFVLFDAPESESLFGAGVVLIMESPHPEQFTRSVKRLLTTIDSNTNDARVQLGSITYGEHQIEFVNVIGVPMFLAPAWTVHEDRVVISLYPQLVMSTLDRIANRQDPGASILGNKDFRSGLEVLGGSGTSVWYVDTKKSMVESYGLILILAQMGAAMVQGEGIPVDISAFPTVDALTRHMFPQVGVTRIDSDGILCASYGPTPITLPSLGSAGGMTTPMMVSILLPSLARARALAKRQVSMANLKGIGVSCHLYSQEHEGRFPDTLKELVELGYVTEEMLHAPDDPTDRVSYVYLGGQSVDMNYRNVLAHERVDLNGGEGVNVLFLDGSVQFIRPPQVDALLEETWARLQIKD